MTSSTYQRYDHSRRSKAFIASRERTATGEVSHAATSALCRSIKLQCEIYPSCLTVICLGPYCSLAFALCCLCSVYSGHQSFLVPPLELDTNHLLK
ncbi:hypothetical protein QQF64_033627 [Cirrhinus molitorella]|uniref:Uncharacterized protein n=1 Tax=Cirrhinus molitorella TaxID=172907 RepID=A0ABR3MUE7_9TELE